MKTLCKRSLTLILTLVLTVSLFSGLTMTADAAVGYNNGVRGKVCTALSSAAKAYYTSGYDWDTLSKLSGTALEAKLRTKMSTNYDGSNSYNGLKSMFQHTDSYQGSSSKMYFFYSGISASDNMNREHIWPKSLSNGQFDEASNTAGADVHHLRPTDAYVNSTRGNRPFGEVTGGTYSVAYTKSGAAGGYYNAGFFEPLDAAKGDCARIIMYVYTRWEQRNITSVFQSTDLLLKWCELDPVDEFEMGRNGIAQQYTNTRNIYIDYPEYCWLVFGRAVPTHMTTPSGKAKTCNKAEYTAAVTTAPSCTANGVETYTCKNCGYSYTEVLPAAGHQYVNGRCTVCGKQQSATQYIYTDQIAAGDQVVILNVKNNRVITTVSSPYTNSNTGVTYQQLTAASATVEGQELNCTNSAMAVFTVVKSGSKYAFKLEDGRYLTCDEPQNLTLDSSPASGTNYWTLESTANSTYYIKNTTTYYENYQKNYQYVEFYAGKFTTYGWNGTNDDPYAVRFYKQVAGASCVHDYQVIASKGATCTEGGSTTYQCTICSETYTETTAALGHDYRLFASADATCTEGGYAAYQCAICSDTYTDTTAALGHDFRYVKTIAPTSAAQGYDLYLCTRCKEEDRRNFTKPTVDAPTVGFEDVVAGAFYEAAVNWAVESGVTTGTSATRFSPEASCTRAQVVTFLWRAFGSPEPTLTSCAFTDVDPAGYYYKAMLWAVEHGITTGVTTTSFAPNSSCTRAQIVTFLWRAEGKPKVGSSDELPILPVRAAGGFTDVESGAYYETAVKWAVANGITTGTSDARFSPDATCTRAQVVTFLYRDRVS